MSPSPVQVPLAAARSVALALALAALALLAAPGSPADPDSGAAASPVAAGLDLGRDVAGGRIPSHFVGLSVEWSLIERYMGRTPAPLSRTCCGTSAPASCGSAAGRRT